MAAHANNAKWIKARDKAAADLRTAYASLEAAEQAAIDNELEGVAKLLTLYQTRISLILNGGIL